MPVEALLLALAAAALHAVWNLLLARARDTEAAAAAMFAVAAVGYAPVAAAAWDVHETAIPFVVASAILELVYLGLLAAAYRRADLSLIYPVARGTAPVLVLVGGAAFVGAGVSLGEAAGVVLVSLGIVLVRGLGRAPDRTGLALALTIASFIAAYTLVDSRGIRHAAPLAYLELVVGPPALLYLVAVCAAKGTAAVRRELGVTSVVGAAAAFGAYGLALAALRLASAASVAAVRETSVVIAVVLAAPVLRERVGRERVAGAALVAGGVALLSLA
ncbi:MAG TPA: EamA family transporter [Gaiellaceae bacterium]